MPTQAPVITDDGRGAARHDHPAFGAISAGRVSGQTALHGSDFLHHCYVRLTIRGAYFRRDLSRDWHHSDRELISVDMSEAQWVHLISSFNTAETPCTLTSVNGVRVPELPRPEPVSDTFGRDLARAMAEIQAELNACAASLGDAVGKRAAAELRSRLQACADRLTGNATFVADSFAEHMEEVTEKAKVEVNAYMATAARNAGIGSLEAGAPLSHPFTIEMREKREKD